LRTSFWPAIKWTDLADLNAQALDWCRQVAGKRKCPGDDTLTVVEAWSEEQKKLLPLPDDNYPTHQRVEVKVGKQPYVRFDLNDYSVPHVRVRRTLTVLATPVTVRISSGPRFLVHDNDGIFGQFGARNAERPYRCHLDLWLRETMGIRGVPTPYRAPNANAYVERFNRTLREDALDHFIFFNEGHIRRVCREYVEFYNRARPSQAIGRIPDPYPDLEVPPRETSGCVVGLPVLGGLQHDYRAAA
jgi:hypothetical protein